MTPAEWDALRISIRVAGVAVALGFPGALWLAYRLAQDRLPFRLFWDGFTYLPLVLPPVVTGYLLLFVLGPVSGVGEWLESVFGLRIAFTWFGAALAAGIVAFPLQVLTMRVAFEQIDPSWKEAAMVYGGSSWQVFMLVTLPLAGRGIAAGVIIAFARAVGEFGATIVLAGNIPSETRTLPLAIFTSLNQVGGEAMAIRLVLIAVALSVVSLVAHAVLTRRLHRGVGPSQ